MYDQDVAEEPRRAAPFPTHTILRSTLGKNLEQIVLSSMSLSCAI